MKEKIRAALRSAASLEAVKTGVIDVLRAAREEEQAEQLGYVAGIVTSDGPAKINDNVKRLEAYTEQIRQEQGYPVFSSTDVFSQAIFDQIHAHGLPNQAWLDFWQDVFGSGHVTDVFMTPRWEQSTGAQDEYETAKRLGLTVHYVEGEPKTENGNPGKWV